MPRPNTTEQKRAMVMEAIKASSCGFLRMKEIHALLGFAKTQNGITFMRDMFDAGLVFSARCAPIEESDEGRRRAEVHYFLDEQMARKFFDEQTAKTRQIRLQQWSIIGPSRNAARREANKERVAAKLAEREAIKSRKLAEQEARRKKVEAARLKKAAKQEELKAKRANARAERERIKKLKAERKQESKRNNEIAERMRVGKAIAEARILLRKKTGPAALNVEADESRAVKTIYERPLGKYEVPDDFKGIFGSKRPGKYIDKANSCAARSA